MNAQTARGAASMPVARYFLFVGGMLLALLFALDAFAPQQMVVADNIAPSKTVMRIRSDQKWPERVVYDTSLPTIVPSAAATRIAAAPAEDVGAQARVRDSFAQFVPAEAKKLEKQPEPQAPRKRKIAKIRQPTRVAQQPHFGFGFFGSSTW
jgi:hypothetical protein